MIILSILVFLALGLLIWAWITGIGDMGNNYFEGDLFGEFTENDKDSIL